MGPIAVFDKSFLQSLSVDESVWFDHYFVSVITPLFFVETLADLEKKLKEGRRPEDEVGAIAEKTPEMSGSPNVFHATLCTGELLGFPVAASYRPVLGNVKRATVGEKRGMVVEVTPEAKALERWRSREFLDVERLYARAWREMLAAPPSSAGDDFLREGYTRAMDCKNLSDVLTLARSIVDRKVPPHVLMNFVFDAVPVRNNRTYIFERYKAVKAPPLRHYAPYTAHVLDVEVFYRLAITKGLIAKERASNRVDVAYLNYLPFCQLFISGDRLHRSTAPLFMSASQDFVWGPELKADLKRINELHSHLPQEVREEGLFAIAPRPPKEGDFLTSKLWDRMNTKWRKTIPLDVNNPKLIAYVQEMSKKMRESANSNSPKPAFDVQSADSLIVDRKVRVKKGSWYQVPRRLDD